MRLMELYENIDNPISSPEVIKKLIELYATCNGNFYSRLTKSTIKAHTRGEHYKADADIFYSMLFNKWKSSILNMTRERFLELRRNGTYGNDFLLLRNYLKRVNDVKSKDEITSLFSNAEEEVRDAYYKYRWNSFGEGTGWVHVASRYVTSRNDVVPEVEHRLYINTDSLDTYKLITLLYKKLEEKKIPIYFKFDEYGSRDDTIVIYTSTKYLGATYEALKEIKNENKDLISRVQDPPILTGKLDGWIGYGSEPKEENGKLSSFNEVRSVPIFDALSKTFTDWIINHGNIVINYNGRKVLFRDYFSKEVMDTYIEDLRSVYSYKSSAFSNDKLKEIYGYSMEDLSSPKFRSYIYKIISEYMRVSLESIRNFSPINITLRGKKTSITKDMIERTVERLSTKIARNDPRVIDEVRTSIIEKSRPYGIDNDNYSFDLLRRDQMIKYDKDALTKLRDELTPVVIDNKKTYE